MCWPGLRAVLVGISWWLLVLTGGTLAGETGVLPHGRVVRVPHNDSLTPANLDALMRQSPTARALMSQLEHTTDTILLVRSHPLLMQQERLYGRGRFWVTKGRLYGLLEYQGEPLGSRRSLRVLAHELGHALELSASPRRRNTGALRSFALDREVGDDVEHGPGIETEFARVIGWRVGLELLGRGGAGSALDAIAQQFAVPLPQPAIIVAEAVDHD